MDYYVLAISCVFFYFKIWVIKREGGADVKPQVKRDFRDFDARITG